MSARVDPKRPLRPSLLDRLIDDEPDRPGEAAPERRHGLAELRATLRRDLQNLLNTRRRFLSWPADLTEVEASVLAYGIPDLTGEKLSSERARQAFLRTIEEVIARFEPRFKTVKVTSLEDKDSLERTLHFRIEALMYADPYPEPVAFDSRLEPTKRSFEVGA